jgi:amino-acid N-acetyltransferase
LSSELAQLRRATQKQYPQIVNLLQADSLPVEDIAEPGVEFLVLESADGVIACGALERFEGCCLLRSLAVEESHRRIGHAARLCEALMSRAASNLYGDIFLLTNDAADYFARYGFEVFNRRRAPLVIRQSRQFSRLCPESAVLMRYTG